MPLCVGCSQREPCKRHIFHRHSYSHIALLSIFRNCWGSIQEDIQCISPQNHKLCSVYQAYSIDHRLLFQIHRNIWHIFHRSLHSNFRSYILESRLADKVNYTKCSHRCPELCNLRLNIFRSLSSWRALNKKRIILRHRRILAICVHTLRSSSGRTQRNIQNIFHFYKKCILGHFGGRLHPPWDDILGRTRCRLLLAGQVGSLPEFLCSLSRKLSTQYCSKPHNF